MRGTESAAGPPLTVPIWYGYEPGGLVWIITGAESLKGRLLNAARRFSLCAQTEEPPFYKYVSVEGPIVDVAAAELEADRRPLAHRYFGPELGDAYVASTDEERLSLQALLSTTPSVCGWRRWDSNPRPPACKAGAL